MQVKGAGKRAYCCDPPSLGLRVRCPGIALGLLGDATVLGMEWTWGGGSHNGQQKRQQDVVLTLALNLQWNMGVPDRSGKWLWIQGGS